MSELWGTPVSNWRGRYEAYLRDRHSLRVISRSTVEPITLAEAALHLRLDTEGSPPTYYEQDLVLALLRAAREFCEEFCGASFAPTTYELTLRQFPGSYGVVSDQRPLELPMGPVTQIQSFSYVDGDGTTQTLALGADFEVDWWGTPERLLPAFGSAAWPTARDYPNSVRVRYVAGYADPGSPPEQALPWQARAALLLVLGHLFENREDVMSGAARTADLAVGIKALLRPYQVRRGFA